MTCPNTAEAWWNYLPISPLPPSQLSIYTVTDYTEIRITDQRKIIRESGESQKTSSRQWKNKMTILWTSVYGVLVVEIGLLVVSADIQVHSTKWRGVEGIIEPCSTSWSWLLVLCTMFRLEPFHYVGWIDKWRPFVQHNKLLNLLHNKFYKEQKNVV